jgi:hypothetical protein
MRGSTVGRRIVADTAVTVLLLVLGTAGIGVAHVAFAAPAERSAAARPTLSPPDPGPQPAL